MARGRLTRLAHPRHWRRAWRLCGRRAAMLGALALLALLGAAAGAPATFAASQANGEIDGNLLDGTTGGTPLAGQIVTLMVHAGAADHVVGTAVTDAHGVFHFTGLATDPSDVYAVTAQYQGATYASDPLSLAGTPHPPMVTLLAYEATASDAKIGVGRVVILVHQPDTQTGTINVSELVTMVNGDQRTFVGTPGPANGKPTGLLRFDLPDGASNLSTQTGFNGAQVIQVNSGFASTVDLPPGQTQFAFGFDYAYDGTRSLFTYDANYPTLQVVVIAPPSMTVTAPGFTSLGKINSLGQQVQVWQSGNLQAGSKANVVFSHLPVPGEQRDLDPLWLNVLAGVVALLALGLVGNYLLRGPGRAGAGAGAEAPKVAAAAQASETLATREPVATPQQLLQALAQLDREHDAGKLPDGQYRMERDTLKMVLKARMLAETGAAGAREQP